MGYPPVANVVVLANTVSAAFFPVNCGPMRWAASQWGRNARERKTASRG
jgi:hypothetical protein